MDLLKDGQKNRNERNESIKEREESRKGREQDE